MVTQSARMMQFLSWHIVLHIRRTMEEQGKCCDSREHPAKLELRMAHTNETTDKDCNDEDAYTA